VTIRCGMTDDAFVQCANPAINFDPHVAFGLGYIPEPGMLICQEHLDRFIAWVERTGWTPTKGET
jgi:hypothetical protein